MRITSTMEATLHSELGLGLEDTLQIAHSVNLGRHHTAQEILGCDHE